MDKIKFGTDGWRAIIAQEFTVKNVARVTQGLAKQLLKDHQSPKVLVGHDCRFAGTLFADTVAAVLCQNGINVVLAKGFVSTPMVSLGVLKLKADQGVIITASHNPPTYNGFKLKGPHGGPSSPEYVADVESQIPDAEVVIENTDLAFWEEKGMLSYTNLEDMYVNYITDRFDLEKLNSSKYQIAYDAMYGAGQNVVRRVLPTATLVHCEYNPGFNHTPPEPLEKYLGTIQDTIKNTPELKMGLVTDGDADRIGLFDEDGKYIDAHHILLLLTYYLNHYKKLTGSVVVAFSVSERMKTLCQHLNLPLEITPIGFKYISAKMITEDVLVGGEESGGIAVKGHIPERDGIYDGLLLLEAMTETGKSIKELIQEIYAIVGAFHYERNDLHLTEAAKVKAITEAQEGKFNAGFGKYKAKAVETIDGVKYILQDGGWIMLRASGTEPVLRIYAEGSSKEEAFDILETVKSVLFN